MQIEDHPFLTSLSEEKVSQLKAGARITRFNEGEIIFEEGSPSDLLYLVLEGSVLFSKFVDEESYHPVSTSQAGAFFGEIGVFTGEPRSLRAEAQTQAVLAALDKEQVTDLIVTKSDPVALTLRSVIAHLHRTTQQFMDDVLHREKMTVVGSMVNTIIHDFKNPFSHIRLATEILTRRHDDKKTRELCALMDQQIDRMLVMAEEVSLYSRGKVEPSFAPVRIAELIERFRKMNFLFFENEAVTITVDVEDLEIEAEEGKLHRVLQNLVGNAIDALSEPGEIRIEGTSRDGFLQLTISDTAGGIPEEIRERFFEPFVTHGKKSGTGLGTAIAKSIVEAHGGTIWFDTKEGEGTTFHIHLPISQEDSKDSEAEKSAESEEPGPTTDDPNS